MDLLIAVALLASLALLASRFGHDSRGRFHTKEFDLVGRGTTWTSLAADLGPERAAGAASAWARQPADPVANLPTVRLLTPRTLGAAVARPAFRRIVKALERPRATPDERPVFPIERPDESWVDHVA